MLSSMRPKVVLNAVAGTTGATMASSIIDTIGCDRVELDIWATTQGASTQAGSPTVLKLQEADNTSASSFVDIVGFRGGSATATNVDFVVPIGVTSGINNYKFNVNYRGSVRKRYLSAVLTVGNLASTSNSQTFYALANLNYQEAGSTAAKAGVLSLIEG